MKRYLTGVGPKAIEVLDAGLVRLVHNFYPGPPDDPGRGRKLGEGGFRAWITNEEPPPLERRCYCGWLDGRVHFGTVGVIDAPAS